MSENDVPRKENPGETLFIQTWGAVEEEHVHCHFRDHDKYWHRHPQKAANSCVRTWQQLHPNEADKLKVHEVIEFRAYVGRMRQPTHSAPAKHKAPVPKQRQPKKYNPNLKVPCSDFPPCQEDFMYIEGLVDHILLKHANNNSMRCNCGQAFTRRIDLQGHIEQVHTKYEPTTPSIRINAKTIAVPPGSDRLNPLTSEGRGRGQEAMVNGSTVEPKVTATSSQDSRNFTTVSSGDQGECTLAATANNMNANGFGPPERSTAENMSEESGASSLTSKVDMGASHAGMRLLPKIEEQLRRSVLNILEGDVVQALPDPKQIFRHMHNITKTTSDMTDKVLSPYRYATFVECRATCLEHIAELSAVVFGDTRNEEIVKIAYGIQSQHELTVGTLLRAYTAAAVTQWVLRVDFRDRYGARGTVGNGPDIRRQNMEDFVKRASPDLYSVLHQKYYQDYLQREVAPHLDCRSWELADNLYHILLRLFNGKVDEVEDGSQQMRGVSAPEFRMSLSNSVRLLLFQIFKEAHELSLLMHKHPVGYDINFPAWPEKYVAEEMRTLELQFSHSGGQVCICVCPRISHKDSLKTIVPASVSLL